MRLNTLYLHTILLVLFGGVASLAWGHGIDIFARVEGKQITGTLSYADGTPVRKGAVQAFAPDGTLLATSETDEAGNFALPTKFRVRHRIVGDAGQGHRGQFTVPESELPLRLPPFDGEGAPDIAELAEAAGTPVATIDAAALETVIARQLGPLREQLHAHEKRVRLRDVFGGIGYVFGVFGVYVLFKQRRASGPAS